MRVLFVAAECYPFVKTGGLADVVGALPKALMKLGADVKVLLPNYRDLEINQRSFHATTKVDLYDNSTQMLEGNASGLNLILLDANHLFDRPGNPYVQENGADWPDNHLRFGALSLAAAKIAIDGVDGWIPDVVHAHDWHAGLTPLYLRSHNKPTPPCCFTIHNLMYQGLFSAEVKSELELAPMDNLQQALGYHDKISYMRAALNLADGITAVSATYASEILTPEFGMGMDDVLRHRGRAVRGIVNGIDEDEWNPKTDKYLPATFDAKSFVRARATNKASLEDEFGLTHEPTIPLLSVVSRLTSQKGMDILLDAIPAIRQVGARLVILGSGDKDLEQAFSDMAANNPDHVKLYLGYDERLAHRIQGGADAILVPSRFEPCGLTQMCGQRYGCIPVVSRVGGLADTVIDANRMGLAVDAATGIQFAPLNAASLSNAVERLVSIYREKTSWRRMVRRAMQVPFGWDASATEYLSFYNTLIADTNA